ncbi:MAG: RNA polymerase sigma factor [Solirubrobacterales bacterium]|nr:RNA polymerase sigma factor [Solirubrobacterales bacterium]
MTTLTATRHEYSVSDDHVDSRLRDPSPVLLDADRLRDHIDALYRAACALCGSRHDAEDLVQETFARVLKRPRFVRRSHELGYLLRALRNTYYSHYRAAARRPAPTALVGDIAGAAPDGFRASEIMQAVASAPPVFRDAVIAVDIVGMSYKEAASALRARQSTITTRLHRGRQHVARVLADADQTH